jgi:23S rRNA (guanosine2251-2'-O)-methyltransferase
MSTKQRRIIYGRKTVKAALSTRKTEVQAVLVTGRPDPELETLAKRRSVTVSIEPKERLDRLAQGGTHQGVVAVAGNFPYLKLHQLQDMLDRLKEKGEPALLTVLDQVQDPRNLGAIVRSAHELGAHAVVLPQRRSASVTAAAVKASAGSTEFLPIVRVGNIARTLEALKEQDISIVAAVGEGGAPPEDLDLTVSAALVMGSEGRGLRPLVERTCDLLVTIPLDGRVGSLNVSVAAGILMAEAARQRRSRKNPQILRTR